MRIIKYISKICKCFYSAAGSTVDHNGMEHAGYMAYLMILSLFPFIFVIFTLAGFVGESNLGIEFVDLVIANLPQKVAMTIEPRMREIMSGPPQSLLTLAIVGAIWTASSTIEGLRTILNIAYGVSAPPAYIWRRLLSIVQLLAIAITIMVITFLLIFIPLVGDSLQYSFIFNAMNSDIVQFISKSAIFMVLFIIVCTIYYVLPNTQLKLRKVVPGAILVVLLWFLSASLLSSYLNHFQQLSLIYGSLGGMIISLLFFYIINLILIYGAEFNHLLDKK